MTEALPQPIPQTEAQPGNPPLTQEIIPPQPKKANRNLWIIGGVALAVLCLCAIAGAAFVGLGIFRAAQERAPITSVLDSYMKYMVAKDVNSAYALFSPRAQRQIPISKIQDLSEGANYVVFDGYLYLTLANLNISAVANTNPNVPQGTVATATGTVNYLGGIQGTFSATLEKVEGEWKIDGINVTVPPSKVGNYSVIRV